MSSCETCGFTPKGKSEAMRAKGMNGHSCEHQKFLQGRAVRAAARKDWVGEVRDCRHKRARHEHGTRTAYVLDRCKCRPCLDANNTAERARHKAKAFGRYDSGRVDAAPVRAHILYLQRCGLGLKRVAKLAGVSNATLGKIIYGDPGKGIKPRARVERHVHDQVLAIRPTLAVLGETVNINGQGTRRRLQALVAIGYSQSYLGRRLGMTGANFARVITDPPRTGHKVRKNVRAETARQTILLYHELSNHPRVGTDTRTKQSVTRSRSLAKAKGWLPPACWDDDRIDDPKHLGYYGQVAS